MIELEIWTAGKGVPTRETAEFVPDMRREASYIWSSDHGHHAQAHMEQRSTPALKTTMHLAFNFPCLLTYFFFCALCPYELL
jgi:hypothetical protein